MGKHHVDGGGRQVQASSTKRQRLGVKCEIGNCHQRRWGCGDARSLHVCRFAGYAGGVCVVLGRFVGCTTAWARGRAEDGTNLMALGGRRHAGGVARGRREGAERGRAS
jgi:hypothetical protein